MARAIHENSRSTYNALRNTLNKREMAVYDAFLQRGAMTDRQVRDCLGFEEMNEVRPRITDLKEKGLVIELPERAVDQRTHRSVRICRAASVAEFLEARASQRQQKFAFA